MENIKKPVLNYRRKFAIIEAARIEFESEIQNKNTKLDKSEILLTKHMIKMIDFTFYGDYIDCRKANEIYPLIISWVNMILPKLSLKEDNGLIRFIKLQTEGYNVLYLRKDIEKDDPRFLKANKPHKDKGSIDGKTKDMIEC